MLLSSDSFLVSGARGTPCPFIQRSPVRYKDRQTIVFLFVPETGTNLLSQNLILELWIGLNIHQNNSDIFQLLVSGGRTTSFSRGLDQGQKLRKTKFPLIHIELKSKGEIVRRKQYQILMEERLRLQPVIEGRLGDGLLESHMSPYNTQSSQLRRMRAPID
jgi:hypothetical protein